jgi:signal transduction histidine kinase
MDQSTAYKKLLYEHEVLWARYEIRDHHLKKIGEKIYDDIGQVLSLVRIQLCQVGFEPDMPNDMDNDAGDLVGKAIRGLRDMHRSFYPETELLAKKGLIKTLEYELQLLAGAEKGATLTIAGTPHDLVNGTQLIVFRMLQEILLSIRNTEPPFQVEVCYEAAAVLFNITYHSDAPGWQAPAPSDPAPLTRLSLPARAELIGGTLSVTHREPGQTRITLTVPFKTSLYEQ